MGWEYSGFGGEWVAVICLIEHCWVALLRDMMIKVFWLIIDHEIMHYGVGYIGVRCERELCR